MSTFVHLIADYGAGDPAFSEVVHRLTCEDPEVTVQPTEVEPLSTVATGFWIAQLGLHNPAFEDLVVYSNTAPRTEETTPDRAAEGGRLCYLELDNGVPVVAVEAGYNLSFVREHVREFRVVETPADPGISPSDPSSTAEAPSLTATSLVTPFSSTVTAPLGSNSDHRTEVLTFPYPST